jgi:chromosome partitioning protein
VIPDTPANRPRIIAIANQKGGVGKTTTVLNLGAALAEIGQRTLLVDLDPQGALSATLGVDPYTVTPNLKTVLDGYWNRLPEAIHRVSSSLWLLPASTQLADPPADTRDEPGAMVLKQVLTQRPLGVDFILIDTPPSMGNLTVNALAAASEFLIPVQCQFLAMRGVRGILTLAQQVHRDLNPELRLLGALATMHRSESELSREVLEELRSVFRHQLFEVVLHDDPVVAEAPVTRSHVLDYQPDSEAAEAFRRLAQEVCNA